MTIKTSKTLWVGKGAYFFLNGESRKQRGCKPLTEDQKSKIWERIKNSYRYKNGMVRIDDNSFGGGDGTYYGKWTSWSIDTISKMLDDKGYKYRNGKQIEYINV